MNKLDMEVLKTILYELLNLACVQLCVMAKSLQNDSELVIM